MQDSWYIIGNPNSGKGNASTFIKHVEEYLSQHVISFVVCENASQQAFVRASDAIQKGYRKFLVCGGDGTINQVVNAIFSQTKVDAQEILVSFIPFGTGNDWIKTIGIPKDSQEALQVCVHGREMKIDIGEVECSWGEKRKIAYFVNIAGFGYDAFVVQGMQDRSKHSNFGRLSYLAAALGFLIKYKPTQMRIESSEFLYEGSAFSGCVGKGKYNGNGMMQCPHAEIQNGKLAVMIMKNISKWSLLLETSRIYKGTFIKNKKIATFETNRLKVDSVPPVRLECEGELLGFSPFEFGIKPKALRILVP